MISAERSRATEDAALDSGACAFLHKPFTSDDVDRVLHAAFGLRLPNLKMKGSEATSTWRSRGRPSVWRTVERPHFRIFVVRAAAFLRNAVVRPAPACAVAPTRVAPAAAKAALLQLRSARLVAA